MPIISEHSGTSNAGVRTQPQPQGQEGQDTVEHPTLDRKRIAEIVLELSTFNPEFAEHLKWLDRTAVGDALGGRGARERIYHLQRLNEMLFEREREELSQES